MEWCLNKPIKSPFVAGLEDCGECKLYPFIYAYHQFDKFKFFILNKLITSVAY